MATAAGWPDVDEWLDAQTREQWRERYACWLLERGWMQEELAPRRSQDGLANLIGSAQQGVSGG